jgi:serine/threonine protein kinase
VDVCDGLLFCHRGCGRGPTAVLLHRDVKPPNVLLHRDRMGRLIGALGDFGISKLYPVGASAVATTATVYGTAGYIAPEVNEGEHPSPLSDAYALGITILQVGARATCGCARVWVRAVLRCGYVWALCLCHVDLRVCDCGWEGMVLQVGARATCGEVRVDACGA